jgi:hypothetical protein
MQSIEPNSPGHGRVRTSREYVIAARAVHGSPGCELAPRDIDMTGLDRRSRHIWAEGNRLFDAPHVVVSLKLLRRISVEELRRDPKRPSPRARPP